MIKVLFICHGNICRSPMAEFVMKDLVKKNGLTGKYEIASAATTYEEIGNSVYPPAKRKLAEHGISCEGKTARKVTLADYKYYDLIIGMDDENREDLMYLFKNDPDNKVRNLSDYAGKIGGAISDPWYTRDFETTWNDVLAGCTGLLTKLESDNIITLDFSLCSNRNDIYDVLKRSLDWQEWYGCNLDALYDILTDLPSEGKKYSFIEPEASSPASDYVKKVEQVFSDAGKKA